MRQKTWCDALLLVMVTAALPIEAGKLRGDMLAEAAKLRTLEHIIYDGRYTAIGYPGGDVASNRGVCTDVLIRSYRRFGIDLQVLVHEDMAKHFALYPKRWGLKQPDTNIDHRRVPNLDVFFSRHGESLPITAKGSDYQAGEIVSWRLANGLPHIGIISKGRSADGSRPLIIHNIGAGPKEEDRLFAYEIVARYRYLPEILDDAD